MCTKISDEHENNDDWKLHLYTRYVDDSNTVVEELPLGARLEEGSIIVKQEVVEGDRNVPGDLRTTGVLCDLTNTVDKMVKIVFDCHSIHDDGLMPILDLKVKVSDMGYIHYQFYRKPMAQHQTILEKSAMPMRMKRQAFSQEVIRILRNTKGILPWLDKTEHLSQFVLRMKDSGYSEKSRLK